MFKRFFLFLFGVGLLGVAVACQTTNSYANNKPAASLTATPADAYEKMLIQYLSSGERLTQEWMLQKEHDRQVLGADVRRWKKSLWQDGREKIESKLTAMFHKNRDKSLEEYDITPETIHSYIWGESADSAALMVSLHQKGMIKNYIPIIRQLNSPYLAISKDWEPIIAQAEKENAHNDDALCTIAVVCYTHHLRESQYRDPLITWAKRGNVVALKALLQDVDGKKGTFVPHISPENVSLVRTLASAVPDIEQTPDLAWYLMAIGEQQQAGDICVKLWTATYTRANTDTPSIQIPDSDYKLYRARLNALPIMFYLIRGERMYHFIYQQDQQFAQGPTILPPLLDMERRTHKYYLDNVANLLSVVVE